MFLEIIMSQPYIRVSFTKNHLDEFATVSENYKQIPKISKFFEKIDSISPLDKKFIEISDQLNIKEATVEAIIKTLVKIFNLKNRYDLNADEVLDLLTNNISKQAESGWKKKYWGKWQKATNELKTSISPDHPVELFQKAFHLSHSHQNVFERSRVTTDIRPVFNEMGDQILATSVNHTLMVDYYDGYQDCKIHLALDAKDVDTLIKQLIRAQKKARTIKTSMQNLPWDTIIVGEENETSR